MATFAVVTDGADRSTVPLLRAAGADVVGLLGPDPFDSLAWSAADEVERCYPDLGDLLRDATDVVCVDDAGPAAVHVTRAALRAGRHVLLTRPVAVDRELLEAADEATLVTAVALRTRAWPAAAEVARAVPGLAGIRQVTVLGWPGRDRLELVDVVRRWCGDVVAVCASPAAMPASRLADAPVTLALLTADGATVVVAEDGPADHPPDQAGAVVTVIGTAGRVLLTGDRLRRQGVPGGEPLPDTALPAPRHPLEAAAAGLVAALREEPAAPAAAGGIASLRDVLVAEQVLAAAEVSASTGGWEEL